VRILTELNWWTLLSKNWGKILGAFLGLIFALIVINYGFWVAIFVFLCIGIGLILGWRLDVGPGLSRLLDRFFKSE
jgi:uncharacterized membrane protein